MRLLPFGAPQAIATTSLKDQLVKRSSSWDRLLAKFREPLEPIKVLIYEPSGAKVRYGDIHLVDFNTDRNKLPEGYILGIVSHNNRTNKLHITAFSLSATTNAVDNENVPLVQMPNGRTLLSAQTISPDQIRIKLGKDDSFILDITNIKSKAA